MSRKSLSRRATSFVVAIVGRTSPKVVSIVGARATKRELRQVRCIHYAPPISPLTRRRNVNKREPRARVEFGLAAFGREKAERDADHAGPNRGFIVNSLTQELSRGMHAWALPHEGGSGVAHACLSKTPKVRTLSRTVIYSSSPSHTTVGESWHRYPRVLWRDIVWTLPNLRNIRDKSARYHCQWGRAY